MQHRLLNKEVRLVQILDDELVVVGAVDVHQDRFDGGFALDEHACFFGVLFCKLGGSWEEAGRRGGSLPRTALTILGGCCLWWLVREARWLCCGVDG